MSNAGIVDISTGVASSIGRYFSVISVVPSSLYVVFVYLLVASGSWVHSPDWNHALTSLNQLGTIGLLAFASIALGVFIHPIQFATVQFFEGYWGTRSLPQAIRYRRIIHYQQLCAAHNMDVKSATDQLA